ncbi:hypothetical protein PG989_002624 [Apiospora arundinis]
MAFTDYAPTPIAQLNPQLPSQTTTVRGVVTVVWPYSSTASSLSFTLAEPEYRLRRPKGQIRVNFAGHVAKGVSDSGIKSGDNLVIALDGVEWEAADTNRRLSGAGHEWQLKFSQKLHLQAKLDDTGEIKDLVIDQPPIAPVTQPAPPTVDPTPELEYSLPESFKMAPAKSRSLKRLADGEFASPAFIKRAQVSYGALFEDGFDIFEDALGMFEEDGGARGKGRKRARFGRQSGAWRYTSQSSPSASPEPEPVPEVDPEPEPEPRPDIEMEVRQEAAIAGNESSRPNPTPRPQMTDEGCQTMEFDLPSPPHGFGASTASMHLYQPTTNADGYLDQGHQAGTPGAWGIPHMSRDLPRTDVGLSVEDEERRSHFAHAIDLDLGVVGGHIQQHWPPQIPEVDPNLNSGPGAQPSTTTAMFPPDYSAGMSSNLSAVRFGFGVPEVMPQYNVMDSDPHQHHQHHHLNYPSLEVQANASPGSNKRVSQSPFAESATSTYPEPELEQATTPANPFLPQEDISTKPVQNAATPSWASINNTTLPRPAPEGRSASSNGQSPDTALVIDNSDTEADAGEIEPDAAITESASFEGEQAVQPDHPEWNVIEGDNYENEVDAQYSDDDEPEYDDNEKGGDYDTRNYVGPNDDEDDSHDEDLRPHPLEPEFDNGEGEEWDEDEDQLDEEEEELDYDEEDEEDDAMDVDTPLQQRQAPPTSKAAPVVIDLLSSDEDDDDEPMPQPSRTTLPATRQAPVAPQAAPSSPQYSSEADAEDYEVEDIISDNVEGDEGDSEDASDNVEDEEVLSENSDSQEQDAHMEDAQHETLGTAVQHSPLTKSNGPDGNQERLVIPSSPGTTNNYTEQAGIDLEAQKEVAAPVNGNARVSDADRETEKSQPDQRHLANKHETFHDSNLDKSGMDRANKFSVGDFKNEPNDETTFSPAQVDDGPPRVEITDRTTSTQDEKDHAGTPSVKNEELAEDLAPSVSGMSLPPPPAESNLLNQLDDKLEAAAKQNLASTRSKASEDQLPTPLDSQLVDQPQAREPEDETNDSEDMVMEVEEVVTTNIATTEQTHGSMTEAFNLATTVKTVSTVQASASTELSEPVFETQVPYLGPIHTTAPDRPSQSHHEPDTQMGGTASPPVFQETLDDDALQSALRGDDNGEEEEDAEQEEAEQEDEVEYEEEEEEEEDDADDMDDDSLQAALRYEEDDEEEEEAEKEEEDGMDDDSLQAALRGEEDEEEDDMDDDSLQAALRGEEEEEEGSGKEEDMDQNTPHSDESSKVATSPLDENASSMPAAAQDTNPVQGNSDKEKDQAGEETIHPGSPARRECSHHHGHEHEHQHQHERQHQHEHAEPARTPAPHLEELRSREQPATSVETGEDSFTDPSVRLARASIASRRASRKRDVTPESTRPHTRSMCFQMSPDYKGDESVRLAKAAFNYSSKSSSRDQSKAASTSPANSKFGEELDLLPGVKAKIRRHLRDSIPEYTELKVLRHHIGKSVDVMAVALMSPADPQRAKGGPREYMMSFTITDQSIGPSAAAEVLLYRPHKDSLPKVKSGDVVLLRNFTVLSLKGKDYGLRTNDTSSWAIFDTEDEPAQIRGPPVEYGDGETTQVAHLREWYSLLNANARSKLERANQKIINAGRASK